MACGPCGSNPTHTFRAPAGKPKPGATSGVHAGSFVEYEVLTAAGKSTGRKFTSLVAASGFAARIGGSTRPV